jgi:SnoaL-like domain
MGQPQAAVNHQSAAIVDRFLDALTERDFEQLAACLAPNAKARLLLPRGAEEVGGRQEIAGRLNTWFGSASEFEVVARTHEAIGTRQRAGWQFRVVRDGQSWELIEQAAFIDAEPDGIRQIDLLCSGFHRETAAQAAPARVSA